VSQPRVSQLVAAWRAGGWEALEPRSSRPRTNPNATPPEVVDRVVALRGELVADGADAGPHTIAALLARELPAPPSVTTIWRILTRAGLVTPEPRKRPKRSWVRFAADLPTREVTPKAAAHLSPTRAVGLGRRVPDAAALTTLATAASNRVCSRPQLVSGAGTGSPRRGCRRR
jgi:hypothetical protein